MRDRQGMKFYYSGICTTMPHLKNKYNLQNVENYFKKSSLSLDILAKHSLREKCVCVLVCICLFNALCLSRRGTKQP